MATYFVDSGSGTDSGSGANTAGTAYYTLKYAVETGAGGAFANGDIVYLNHTHVEDFSATVYGTAGAETIDLLSVKTNFNTGKAPVYFISSDFAVGSGTTFRPMSTGKIDNPNGTLQFLATAADGSADPNFHTVWYGITFRASANYLAFADPYIAEFEDCKFAFGSNLTSRRIRLDGNALVIIRRCTVDFENNACQTFLEASSNETRSDIQMSQVTFANVNASPTDSLLELGGSTNPAGVKLVSIYDCDLSSITSIVDSSVEFTSTDVKVTRCKTKDTWANMETNQNFGPNGIFTNSRVRVTFNQCSNTNISATPLGLSYRKTSSGSIEQVTSEYYTASPATDGENNYSWRLTPSTTCNAGYPLGGFVSLGIRHPGGNKVLRIRMLSNFSALTDAEVVAEVHAPGNSTITGSSTIGTFIYTGASFNAGTSQLNTRTVSPGTTTFSSASHGFVEHQKIWFKSTGVLNTGIVEGKIYFVRDVSADEFKVAASPGGTAITYTDDDTGTVTAYPLLVSGSTDWTGVTATGYSFEIPVYATEPGNVEARVFLTKPNSGANEKLWIHPELELF